MTELKAEDVAGRLEAEAAGMSNLSQSAWGIAEPVMFGDVLTMDKSLHGFFMAVYEYCDSTAREHRAAASLIRSQAERIEKLEGALATLQSDAAHVVDFYHRNGPTWTGKDGHEYDDMSSVIGRAEETLAAIAAALERT